MGENLLGSGFQNQQNIQKKRKSGGSGVIVDLAHSVDYKGMLGRSSTTIVLDTSPMKLFTTLHGLQVRILYFFPRYETSKLG